MKTVQFFPGDGKFYKANLHCHSTFSDGQLTVSQIKEAYKARGYSAVAFSDHNTLTPHNELTDDGFVALNAVEIDFNQPSDLSIRGWFGVSVYHLNFISEDKDRTSFIPFDRVYGVKEVQKVIDDANAAGFLVSYNHPRWSYQNAADFTPLKGLFGFEVFNTGCEVTMADGYGDYEYEEYCRRGGTACAIACDDNHNGAELDSPYSDSFGGWTMIKAEELSYGALYNALKSKNCYASTGAAFKEGCFFRNEKGGITVKGQCEPCCEAYALTDARMYDVRRSHADDISSFEFSIPGDTVWFRLELRDKKGGRAYTRNYLASELD
ncbi:MAG: PHP domain-containing protein [Clostridia bacterium]|nr:PHP domain-containing protein [Clostridia bacterium]